MDIRLRAGTSDDARACGIICYEAFKSISEHHNFPPDFPEPEMAIGLLSYLLTSKDIYSVVAEVEGRIAGSNFLWEQTIISGVGPITVDPQLQNVAVGRRLMEDVMRRSQDRGFAGIRLVQAAYHNRSLSLYTKLGFDTREPLSAMQGAPINLKIPGREVRAAKEDDLKACNKLCIAVHGHDREKELMEAIRAGTATIVEQKGRITGYSTTVGFLGHSVAETNDDLKALIGAATAFPGPGFLLPTRNSELLRWCFENKLRIVMPMTLMTMGLYNKPRGSFLPSVIY
jgi:ribosomal protein S18 acetylase RimI-like enzyme